MLPVHLARLSPRQALLVKRSLEKFFYSAGTNVALYNAVKSEKGQEFKQKINKALLKQIIYIARLEYISQITQRIKKQKSSLLEQAVATYWFAFREAFEGGQDALISYLFWAAVQGGQTGLDKMIPQHQFSLQNLELKEKIFLRADFLPETLDKTGIVWVSQAVDQALKQGMKSSEIVKFLRDAAREVAAERSQLVVETELMTAMNLIELETYRRNSIERIRWKTAQDERVEAICLANEAAGAINVGETFPMGQMSPPAHIRCRCYLLPILPTAIQGTVWVGE